MVAAEKQRASLREIFTRDFLVISLISFTAFFGFQTINVGLPVYMSQLGAGTHLIGLATTIMTVAATAMRIFSGALLDRFGRLGVLIAGGAVMACTIVSYAIFPIVGVILGLRVLHGIGWGLGSTASSTIAADIIPKHRFAEGMGYFSMAMAVSNAIAPAVAIELLNGTGAIPMLGMAAGVTAVSFALSLFQYFATRKGAPAAPSSAAQAPASAPAAPGSAAPAPAPISKLETFFDRRAVLPGLFMFSVNIGFGCITTFIALHAAEQGIANVSLYFLCYALVTIVTRPLIGKLIDRYGYRWPAICALLSSAVMYVLIGISTNLPMLLCAGALAGLGIGTAMGTFQAMAVARVEPFRRGVATSTYMTLFDLGIAAGSLAGGVIAGMFGYTVMYALTALFPLATAFVAAAKIRKNEGVIAPNSPSL